MRSVAPRTSPLDSQPLDATHISHEDLSGALGSMSRGGPGRRRPKLLAFGVAAVAVLAFGAAAVAVVQNRASASPTQASNDVPTVQTIEADHWRFTVHLPTGAEALFDLSADPKCRNNLIRAEPDRAVGLRTALLERCGVGSMSELREPHRELTDTLRRLGYL